MFNIENNALDEDNNKFLFEKMSKSYIDKADQYVSDENLKKDDERKAFMRGYKKAHVEELNSLDLDGFKGIHVVSAFASTSETVGGKEFNSSLVDGLSYLGNYLNEKIPGEQSVYIAYSKNNNPKDYLNFSPPGNVITVVLDGHWTGMYDSDAMTNMGHGKNVRKYYGGRENSSRIYDMSNFAFGPDEIDAFKRNPGFGDEGVIANAKIAAIIFSSNTLKKNIDLYNQGYIPESIFVKVVNDVKKLITKLKSFTGQIIDLDGVVKDSAEFINILSQLSFQRNISPEERQSQEQALLAQQKQEAEFASYRQKFDQIKDIKNQLDMTMWSNNYQKTPFKPGNAYWLYDDGAKQVVQNLMSGEDIANKILQDITLNHKIIINNVTSDWKDWKNIPEFASRIYDEVKNKDMISERKRKRKKVDYKKAYKKYHSSEKAKKARAQRNAARRAIEKSGVKIPKGYEVDHKNPISNGGSNDVSNLRLIPKKKNRKLGQKITTKKRKSKGKY